MNFSAMICSAIKGEGVDLHKVDVYSEICEIVVAPDVSIVCGEGHQEVDEGQDDQGAGDRR